MTTTHATATPTTFAAATWAEANKVAEEITLAELHALLAADRYDVTIFPGKGKQPHYALTADVDHGFDHLVRYMHKTRTGHTLAKVQVLLTLPEFTPIFAFYNLGRVVRVVPAGR